MSTCDDPRQDGMKKPAELLIYKALQLCSKGDTGSCAITLRYEAYSDL